MYRNNIYLETKTYRKKLNGTFKVSGPIVWNLEMSHPYPSYKLMRGVRNNWRED